MYIVEKQQKKKNTENYEYSDKSYFFHHTCRETSKIRQMKICHNAFEFALKISFRLHVVRDFVCLPTNTIGCKIVIVLSCS